MTKKIEAYISEFGKRYYSDNCFFIYEKESNLSFYKRLELKLTLHNKYGPAVAWKNGFIEIINFIV